MRIADQCLSIAQCFQRRLVRCADCRVKAKTRPTSAENGEQAEPRSRKLDPHSELLFGKDCPAEADRGTYIPLLLFARFQMSQRQLPFRLRSSVPHVLG